MILKIAWRNIWRSRTRSFTVIGAIIIGVWALISALAFTQGFIHSYVNTAVENELSHLQMHHPKFKEDRATKYMVENASTILNQLQEQEAIEAFAGRSLIQGILNTSRGASRGIQLRGIDASLEASTTKLDQKIVEGTYFDQAKTKKGLLMSARLGDKLRLKVGSKVNLSIQDTAGNPLVVKFKIIGFFKTNNAVFDKTNVFVEQKKLDQLLGSTGIHEIAMLLNDPKELEVVKHQLAEAYPNALVETYREIAPDVNLYESQMSVSTYMITVIIMLALIFGIINTMLMAVLERTRELGMLMAVGMKRGQVFLMVVLETLCLGLLAAPLGLLLGYLTVWYYGTVGLDLSAYAESMENFGVSSIVYMSLEASSFLTVTLSVLITAFLGAIYPAYKATRLNPTEAMQKI